MKLTTGRLFLAMLVLTVVGVLGGLLWLHDPEPPEDPSAPPTGPSSILRGIARRAAERDARDRAAATGTLERLLTDAGL